MKQTFNFHSLKRPAFIVVWAWLSLRHGPAGLHKKIQWLELGPGQDIV